MELDTVHFKPKDFIPFFGIFSYYSRNKGKELLSSYELRDSALMIYNIILGASLGLGAVAGLEKLMNQ